MSRRLIVVTGPPCAGKTTYCQENKSPDDVVVDFDKLAVALGSEHAHDAPKGIRKTAFAAREAAIDHVLDQPDLNAWVIHTKPPAGALSRYAEAGAEIVTLDPGIEECLRRAEDRPDWTVDAIRDWYSQPPKGGHMQIKSAPVSVKSVDSDSGIFEAIVSVFGNVDSYGDVVVPGAFADTLAEWEAKGDPIPVYWSHRMDDPDYNIGHVLEAKEVDEGLWVRAQLDLGAGKSDQVHRLLKGRRVTQFSFAYDVIEGGTVERDGETYYELRKLKLYEVGPTPIGANQETELLAVKAADVAAGLARLGTELSKSHIDHLRSAQDAIAAVLAEVEKQDQEKASGEAEAKSGASDEEPAGAKSPAPDEEPKSSPSARVLAAQSLLTLNGVH